MWIEIEHLSKKYPDGTVALDDVNLVIEDGLFALIGPNGSGKTTLIRILATLLKPSGGSVSFDSLDLRRNRAEIRYMIGYLPQRFSTFTNTTAAEFLDYSARLVGMNDGRVRAREVSALLESLELDAVRDMNANELSPIEKRRLEIAQALIGKPEVILMDEPTVGLSPEERIQFRKLLVERCAVSAVTIFATHILTDISSTCTGVAVLDGGNVVYSGTAEGALSFTAGNGITVEPGTE